MDANKRRFTPCQSTRRCGSVLWRCTLISAPRCRPKCELRTNVCAAPGHASCLPKTVHTQTVKSILQSPIEFVSVKNVQPNEITLLGLICTKEFGLSLELSSFCDDSKKEQLLRVVGLNPKIEWFEMLVFQNLNFHPLNSDQCSDQCSIIYSFIPQTKKPTGTVWSWRSKGQHTIAV